MSLETALYPSQLNANNPAASDPKSQGDDHLRTIKQAVKNVANGFPGHVLVAGADTGVMNAYVLTPATPIVAYTPFMTVLWIPSATNSGASTVNISGLGVQNVRRVDGLPLANGDLVAGNPTAMLYTGTEFRLLSMTQQQIFQLSFSSTLPGQASKDGMFLGTAGELAGWTNKFGVAVDEAKSVAIASASTMDLRSPAATGNFIHVTGAATINAIQLEAGAVRDLVFDSTPLLKGSANLIVPGHLVNLQVRAGDTCRVRGEGGGIVRVVDYTRRDGRALQEQTAPGLVMIAEWPSAAGQQQINFLSTFTNWTYDDFLVKIDGFSSGGGQVMHMQVCRDGIIDNRAVYTASTMNATGATLTDHFNTTATVPNGTGRLNGEFSFYNVKDATATAEHGFAFKGMSGGASSSAYALAGVHRNAGSPGAVSGFRIYLPGGDTFAAGVVRVYGYRDVMP